MGSYRFFCLGNPGGNLGDVAAMYGLVYGLHLYFPDGCIDVSYSCNPDTSGIDSFVHKYYSDDSFFSRKGICRLLMARVGILKMEEFDSIKKADVIIVAPGACGLHESNFFHWIKLFIFLKNIKRKNNKVVFHGCSMGPFHGHALLFQQIVKMVDLITLRDYTSKKYLKDAGLDSENFLVTGDSAMILPAMEALQEVDSSKRIVGITPIDLKQISIKGVSSLTDKIMESMIDAIHLLQEKYSVDEFHFISHIPGDEKEHHIIQEIISKTNAKCKVIEHTSPLDALREYQSMYLCVSARHHGGAFALKMGVPCVCIGYEHKARGFFEQYGLERYVVDVCDMTNETLQERIIECAEHHDEIVALLRQYNPKVEANARLNTKYLQDMLLGENKK